MFVYSFFFLNVYELHDCVLFNLLLGFSLDNHFALISLLLYSSVEVEVKL